MIKHYNSNIKTNLEILPVYRENCPKCMSTDTRSYIEYQGTKITLVCKNCNYRWLKND